MIRPELHVYKTMKTANASDPVRVVSQLNIKAC